MGDRWEVAIGVVRVCGKVYENQVYEELNDLEPGDPFLPPDTDTSCAKEVVPVHDDMHSQVQGDWNPFDGSVSCQLGVA